MSEESKLKLEPYQKATVQKIVSEPTKAALIASITGSGKTLTALTAAKELGAKTILVVAPGDTFQNPKDGWQREARKVLPELPNRLIDSKHLDNFELLKEGQPGIYYVTQTWFTTCSTEVRKKDKVTGEETITRKPVLSWTKVNRKLDVAIIDECHRFSNRNASGQKALKQVSPRLLKIAMSATPGGDKFDGLWAPTRWLWPTATKEDGTLYVDRSYHRWVAKFAETKANPFAGRGARTVIGERVPGEFTSSLPCYIRDQPTENVKVNVDPWFEVELDMTPTQKKQYQQMLEKSIAWVRDNPLVAKLPMAQKVRLRQMCLGEVHIDDEGNVDFPEDTNSTKIDATIKIVTERHPNDKVVVFVGDSEKFAAVLAKRLQQAGVTAEAWTGKVSKAKRRKLKDRFVRGSTDDLQVLVCSIATMDGVDGLQTVCNTEIWVNKALWGIKNEQAEGRLNRRGQAKDSITRYDLIVPGTADAETFALDARKFIRRMAEL